MKFSELITKEGTLCKGDYRMRTAKENDFHIKSIIEDFGEIGDIHKYFYKIDVLYTLYN